MSDKTPFQPEGTVIRPGGYRFSYPSETDHASSAYANAPDGGDLSSLESLKTPGINPLIDAAAPLFELMSRLRSMPTYGDPVGLRNKASTAVSVFEREIQNAGIEQKQVQVARYAICATIDDVVMDTPWGNNSDWHRNTLVSLLHNEVIGGDRFFEFLDQMLRNPNAFRSLIEFMYVCLALGFSGRYRLQDKNGQESLRLLRANVYRAIRGFREDDRALSIHWRGVKAPLDPEDKGVPGWVALIIAGALLAGVFAAYRLLLGADVDTAAAAFAELDPAGPPRLIRPVEVHPVYTPPPVVEEAPRIRRFLAPEIEEGLVKVDEDRQTLTIRIRGEGMFPSGQASVLDQHKPTIRRVAEALSEVNGHITVIGYTDNLPIHSVQFPSNIVLSEKRAQSVASMLAESLTDPDRLTTEGRGASNPIGNNTTAEGRALNRRIEIVLVKEDPIFSTEAGQ